MIGASRAVAASNSDTPSEGGSEPTLVRRERDLYRRLLDLGSQNEIEPFIGEALALVTEVAGAHQGYLELVADGDAEGEPRWSAAHGFSADQIAAVRSAVSQGIIAAALQSGKTIVTQSALLDPRFQELESVRVGRIEAVLCAPIGSDPPTGVLYLQRRLEPGSFSEEDRRRVEMVARHLSPFAERLLAREEARAQSDAVRPLRERLRLDGVVGRSDALAAVLREVAIVAPLEVNVLLTGESGTGKSQIARVIHDNGPRAGRTLVELNCAAIPETLLENELFGAMPGGHSTASARMPGKVAAAEGGTLFLDEVAELPLPAQAKLLQLLQSKVYYPLGSAKAFQADVRVIAATNTDLEAAVRDHRFREDLFYRLQVLPLRLPSLAERREDIPELAAYFCRSAVERHKLAAITVSRDAVRALEAAEWPGNIRQLEHFVEAATIRAAAIGAKQVERAHLFPTSTPAAVELEEGLTFQEATRRFQARLLRETIESSGWNVVETAKRLDLTRSHVYNLIRAFGLERERK
jgi:transcriptional regulator with GAF, ATPase, and Fis domain